MRNPCALATQLNTMITSAILLNTHNDVSKKARPKGHIAIKLYNVAKAHPTTTTRNNSHKCSAAALRNKRSDNRKDLTFHVFPKNPCRRLISHCPFSNARSFTITVPAISFGVNC